MKRVLFLTQTCTPVGGVQRWIDLLSSGLGEHGWETIVGLAWGLRFHDPWRFRAAHPGLRTILLDGRSGTKAGRLLAIQQAIARCRPDVVVPVGLVDPLEAIAELRVEGRGPRLLFGSYEISARILKDVRRYSHIIDRALGVSRVTVALLKEVAGIASERVDYVPSGVPRARRLSAPTEGPLRVGYVGRLDPDKRPLDVIAIFAELERQCVPFSGVIVGDGSLRSEVVERAGPLIENGRLRVMPPLATDVLYEDVYPYLDVHLLCSPAEGLSSVMLETMSHGIAQVTSDFAGRAEQGIVKHGVTGLVFPIGDLREASRQLIRLVQDEALRSAIARAALEYVVGTYGVEKMIGGWASALDTATAGPLRPIEASPAAPAGRDRLARIAGRRLAEGLRRAVGRRWEHPDAGEWPFATECDEDERVALEHLIEESKARLSAPNDSGSPVVTRAAC